MKIGIMGGTFDPPHIGHLVIAEQAYQQLQLDAIWFAPVGQPPHKDNQLVTPAVHRVEMTRLAIRNNPHFALIEDDVKRPAPHYITVLFEMLQEAHRGYQWYLIIGGDSFVELPRWYQPSRLLQLTRLAVALRPGYIPDMPKLEESLPGVTANTEWLDSPLIDLASHDLQRRARMGLSLRYIIPDRVADYIHQHQLYSNPSLDTMVI